MLEGAFDISRERQKELAKTLAGDTSETEDVYTLKENVFDDDLAALFNKMGGHSEEQNKVLLWQSVRNTHRIATLLQALLDRLVPKPDKADEQGK